MHLPQRNFRWVTDLIEECRRLVHQLPSMNVQGVEGSVTEVDLLIPSTLHLLLNMWC